MNIDILVASVVIIFIVIIVITLRHRAYWIERKIIVNQDQENLFSYLRKLDNMKEWSVWAEKDPEMKITYSGNSGEVGSTCHWVGTIEEEEGHQEILAMIDDAEEKIKGIKSKLTVIKPWKSKTTVALLVREISDNESQVIWQLSGKLKFPATLFMTVEKMDKMIGSDFEKSLNNLKERIG